MVSFLSIWNALLTCFLSLHMANSRGLFTSLGAFRFPFIQEHSASMLYSQASILHLQASTLYS